MSDRTGLIGKALAALVSLLLLCTPVVASAQTLPPSQSVQYQIEGTWSGSIDWGASGSFTASWQFLANGRAVSPGTTEGVWRWEGPWLQINAIDGNGNRIDYRGRIDGDVLTGRAIATADTETFHGWFTFERQRPGTSAKSH